MVGDELADVLEDVLEAGALEVDVLEDEEADEHPPISAAITATTIPHAAKRARLSLNMVLSLSFREKGHASRHTLKLRPARLSGTYQRMVGRSTSAT